MLRIYRIFGAWLLLAALAYGGLLLANEASAADSPQGTFFGQNFSSGGGVTPGFVNESSFNSTQGSSVTTRATGTTTCSANFTDCIPLADPALAGNLIAAYGTFAKSTVITPTVTDDKGDTG